MTLKYIMIMDYFTENQNTAIYTTKYIIDQGSPILNVYHYKDGSWQFSGKETALQDCKYPFSQTAQTGLF